MKLGSVTLGMKAIKIGSGVTSLDLLVLNYVMFSTVEILSIIILFGSYEESQSVLFHIRVGPRERKRQLKMFLLDAAT